MKNILIVLLLLLQSCSGQNTFTIEKGAHYPKPNPWDIHWGVEKLEKTVVFDSTCLYKLGTVDDGDINKLFGWGVGLTAKHSLRIGWNCKSGTGIDLYAYIHFDGKRWLIHKEAIITGSGQLIGKGFVPGIPIACGIYRARDSITFTAKQGTVTRIYKIRFAGFPDGYGFYQYPYFGGTTPAPHRMKIIIY